MKRILLALLALMTGLIAQVGPVHARIGSNADTEIGAADGARGTARPAPAQTQTAQKERCERQALRVRPSRGRVYIPSVLFGPDRAFE
jgi:hypothetical protein